MLRGKEASPYVQKTLRNKNSSVLRDDMITLSGNAMEKSVLQGYTKNYGEQPVSATPMFELSQHDREPLMLATKLIATKAPTNACLQTGTVVASLSHSVMRLHDQFLR